ncbi:hypothetical protein BKA93DRAFT_184594 [Sparassis latifolia]
MHGPSTGPTPNLLPYLAHWLIYYLLCYLLSFVEPTARHHLHGPPTRNSIVSSRCGMYHMARTKRHWRDAWRSSDTVPLNRSYTTADRYPLAGEVDVRVVIAVSLHGSPRRDVCEGESFRTMRCSWSGGAFTFNPNSCAPRPQFAVALLRMR